MRERESGMLERTTFPSIWEVNTPGENTRKSVLDMTQLIKHRHADNAEQISALYHARAL